MADTTQISSSAVDAAKRVYDTAAKVVGDKSSDPRLAHQHGARAASDSLSASAMAMAALGGTVSVGAEIAAKFIELITKAKQVGQPGMHDLLAASLGDVLQIDISGADIPVGLGVEGQAAVNAAIGKKFLDSLRGFFAPTDAVTGDTAEKAAETFVGFGMQFSSAVGFLGLLGEIFTIGHVKELSEIGEILERSLGLGRLTRLVLAPLIQNTISKPYDRKLRAQYMQDLLGAPELVKGMLAGRLDEAAVQQWLAEHGYSEAFRAELVAQHTPSLHESDVELLQALGRIDSTSADGQLKAQGIPDSIIAGRLAVLTWKRLQHVREALLAQVFSEIQHGFQPASAMDDVLGKLGIPSDEADLWRQRVGFLEAVPRKRLSEGQMLFLYEAAQVTLSEVQDWAAAEGYSPEDQLRIQLFFQLKATAAHSTKSGGSAAKATHVHNEHVFYVWEQFMAAFQRPPTPAESEHYVGLLDTGDANKADVHADLTRIAKGNLAP